MLLAHSVDRIEPGLAILGLEVLEERFRLAAHVAYHRVVGANVLVDAGRVNVEVDLCANRARSVLTPVMRSSKRAPRLTSTSQLSMA